MWKNRAWWFKRYCHGTICLTRGQPVGHHCGGTSGLDFYHCGGTSENGFPLPTILVAQAQSNVLPLWWHKQNEFTSHHCGGAHQTNHFYLCGRTSGSGFFLPTIVVAQAELLWCKWKCCGTSGNNFLPLWCATIMLVVVVVQMKTFFWVVTTIVLAYNCHRCCIIVVVQAELLWCKQNYCGASGNKFFRHSGVQPLRWW